MIYFPGLIIPPRVDSLIAAINELSRQELTELSRRWSDWDTKMNKESERAIRDYWDAVADREASNRDV